jgi:hypothetical protein
MDTSRGDRSRKSDMPRISKKRGQYGARSCLQCRRRKVKCAGGFPCIRCISQMQDCDFPTRARESEISSPAISASGRNAAAAPSIELLQRLTQLSGSVSALVHDAEHSLADKSSEWQAPTAPTTQQTAAASCGHSSNLDNHPSAPHLSRVSTTPTTKASWTWLENCLSSYGLEANQDDWRSYLHTYFREMHVFFPFITLPQSGRLSRISGLNNRHSRYMVRNIEKTRYHLR